MSFPFGDGNQVSDTGVPVDVGVGVGVGVGEKSLNYIGKYIFKIIPFCALLNLNSCQIE